MRSPNNIVKSVNPHEISSRDLDKIFEIEQDMWARWIWEYVHCGTCDSIFSKLDIYGVEGSFPLTQEIRTLTVMEIEGILGIKTPSCPCCLWETTHIYDKLEYLPAMIKRYEKEESFLSLAYDSNSKIIGFMDWYIATLEEIFEEELSFHYSENLLDELKRQYSIHRKQKMITFSSIWTDDKNKSLVVTFALIENLFHNLDPKYDQITWIFESIIASSTYCIFKLMWAKGAEVNNIPNLLIPWSQNDEYLTDVLIHKDVIPKYRNNFQLRTRDVLLYSRELRRVPQLREMLPISA